MPVSLKDVAKAAGVSKSTVSRAFDKDAICRPITRRKILNIASKMGYRPSFIARSLTTNSTRLIGLVVDNFDNPFFMKVFENFTRELHRLDFGCLIINSRSNSDPKLAAEMLIRYNVDGVIIASSTLPETFVEAIQVQNIPIVHTFGQDRVNRDISVVGIDNVDCGKLAARAIYSKGYSKIALIAGPRSATTTIDRVIGFRLECDRLNLDLVSENYADAYDYPSGQRCMTELISSDVMTDAVFCGDDLICMGAMDAAKKAGLKIPDDIGFIGVNDMPMASWDSFSITTISQPIAKVVASSANLMTLILDRKPPSKHIRILTCELVERSSL